MSKTSCSRDFYKDFPVESGFGRLSISLMQCEDDNPPVRETPSVKTLYDIKWIIEKPWSELETFKSATTGKQVRRLRYVLQMSPSGASLDFVILVDGVRQGAENAQVKFE